MKNQAAISIVVTSTEGFAAIRRTVRFLRAQTIADQIELIIVASDQASLSDMKPGEVNGFGEVIYVYTGRPLNDVDRAGAIGLLSGTAPVVSTIEDHAYPEAGWAEAVLEAYDVAQWSMVGSVVVNANPTSSFSWSNQLMAYGEWTEPVEGGEMNNVSRHNASFKRSAIEPFGDDLPDLFARGGGLLPKMRQEGHRFYVAKGARIHHLNPSKLSSTVELRFFAGWLSGGSRARREGWPLLKRLVYFCGSPLIPLVRFNKMREKLFSPMQRGRLPRLLPAVFFVLILDSLGQMFGFLFGPGRMQSRLMDFEHDRLRHLTHRDRNEFTESA